MKDIGNATIQLKKLSLNKGARRRVASQLWIGRGVDILIARAFVLLWKRIFWEIRVRSSFSPLEVVMMSQTF
ncbi:hypothetical protein J5N97_017410 [Dioscorea zingiberensis]|uniref:Uncharacterized protein n=1 Tax=Dioscorea zingiberensis TaxID=325984 RepID=A0A9D5CP09_9LILI|nr:hypothetical protein J5N97_017410 [Dioscorea zingiberensis]